MSGIDELRLEYPSMGARMLRRELHRQGVEVGRRHIATRTHRIGVQALAPQTGTSKRATGHKIYPYPMRKLAMTLEACHAREVIEQELARWGTPENVNTN